MQACERRTTKRGDGKKALRAVPGQGVQTPV